MKVQLPQTMCDGQIVKDTYLIRRISLGFLLASVVCGLVAARLLAARHAKTKVLGLDKVIVFTYFPSKGFDPRQLHSVTLIGPVGAGDWKYWQSRGVVAGVGHTWYDLLRSPIDKAVDLLTGQDFGGNPKPVTMIDEFGFDFGGQMDEKSAQVLPAVIRSLDIRSSNNLHDARFDVFSVQGDMYRSVDIRSTPAVGDGSHGQCRSDRGPFSRAIPRR